MRAAEPVDQTGKADVVPIAGSAKPRHPTPVYASRPDDSDNESSLDATLRGLPAQLAQWLIVFGALGLVIGGAKWWAGRGEAGAQPSSSISASLAPAAPASGGPAGSSVAGSDATEPTDARAPMRAPAAGAEAAEDATAPNGSATNDYLLTTRVRAPSEVPYPRRLHDVQPALPEGATVRQGIAVLSLLIDTRGNVVQVEILRGIDAALDTAAVAAARQWKFAPTVHDGRPVAVYSNFTVRFGY